MNQLDTVRILNQTLELLGKSLPQFLDSAAPYVGPGQEKIREAFSDIAANEESQADRIRQFILDSEEIPIEGDFPMAFTDMFDLGIEYFIKATIECLQSDLPELKSYADQLYFAPTAKALVEEAIGMTKGHLETLQDLAATV